MKKVDRNTQQYLMGHMNLTKRGHGVFLKSGRSFVFNGVRKPGSFHYLTEEGDFLSFNSREVEAISEGGLIEKKDIPQKSK